MVKIKFADHIKSGRLVASAVYALDCDTKNYMYNWTPASQKYLP